MRSPCSTPCPMTRQRQCSQTGAIFWMAHSKESNTSHRAMGCSPYCHVVRRDGLARSLTEGSARLHVDGRRPDRSVFFGHAPVRSESRVLVPPELEVHQVLGARDQRPPANPPGGRVAHLVLQETHALAHHGLRNAP